MLLHKLPILSVKSSYGSDTNQHFTLSSIRIIPHRNLIEHSHSLGNETKEGAALAWTDGLVCEIISNKQNDLAGSSIDYKTIHCLLYNIGLADEWRNKKDLDFICFSKEVTHPITLHQWLLVLHSVSQHGYALVVTQPLSALSNLILEQP